MTRSSGQSVVELAITLPVMLLLVLGIIALGQIVREYQAVRSAASQAAFAAARAPSADVARSQAGAAGHEAVSGTGVEGFQVSVDTGSFTRGGVVTATATGFVSLGSYPLVTQVLGRHFPLSWQARAMIEPYRSRS